jgi:hypothetical protein
MAGFVASLHKKFVNGGLRETLPTLPCQHTVACGAPDVPIGRAWKALVGRCSVRAFGARRQAQIGN